MNRLLCLFVLGIAVLGVTPSTRADLQIYTAFLSAPDTVTSPGTGFASVGYDPVAHMLHVSAVFGDLVGTTTAAHIHAPTATPLTGNVGVAVGYSLFPTGVTSGAYSASFDLTDNLTYSTSFLSGAGGGTVAGAEAALAASLDAKTAYVNIHTSAYGGGEIRGFLRRTVPEPSALMLWGLGGIVGLLGYSWRRRRK